MSDFQVGGQAVIEGVMIRSETHIATAVRRADNTILVKKKPYIPLSKRMKVFSWPVLRGFVALFEMMGIGISSLNFSAETAGKDIDLQNGKEITETKSNTLMLILSIVFALGVGVAFFFFLPLWITSLFGVQKDALLFNLIAGGIRVTMFITYVWILTFFKDFRRIFEYHGAEHKTIWAYEMKEEVTVENASKYTTLHPRCGTSFILIVALFAILIFAIADTIYQLNAGHSPQLFVRFGVHLALLPLVSGGSYELLKLSGRTRDNRITKFMIKPGLWLQLITTKEPSAEQLEVAVVAVRASLSLPQNVEVRELADA
ncbi:MAG: DUF1385 domain-containing protein [candidate division Zixibacteria bacterium]|nr:DUF1385 domain-containing protein [candidate division Zixibacteria bacterium]